MTVTLILGLQWGDEGKGKIVDLFAKDYEYIVRFNGGDNAGHTVIKGEEEFKLHLLPSGIFYPEKTKIIGNGLVVNPETLVKEIEVVENRGYSLKNLAISSNANIILEWHKLMDGALDKSGKIGTTKKGIGPAYSDKASRTFALRMSDLLLPENELATKIEKIAKHKKKLFKAFDFQEFKTDEILQAIKKTAKILRPYITDTQFLLNKAVEEKNILLEGAQGTLLDLDHGTFPYVTSSNTTAGAASTGTGIPPNKIDKIVGIAKAYTTRVGEGPFPTELTDKLGEKIREAGHEFGTTTGRPRRCGWLDLVILKYTCMVNGTTEIVLTKLDVLSGLKELKVCTAYEIDKHKTSNFPLEPAKLEKVKPIYKTLEGWNENITECKKIAELPSQAKAYIKYIEEQTGVPVKIVSVGPKRDETIIV
ncbi:adenylosuccinate synthase [Candidatus Micrarchaeota archaeon]|nr:adenylosuccinate synthase [Candidatus Micrarchaeota archaeon]